MRNFLITANSLCVVFAKRPYNPFQARSLGADRVNTINHCSVPWIGVANNRVPEENEIIINSCSLRGEDRETSFAQQHRTICQVGCHDPRMDPQFKFKPKDQKVGEVHCNCAPTADSNLCVWQARYTKQYTGGNLICNYTRFNTPGFFKSTSASTISGNTNYPDNIIEIISMGKASKKNNIVFNSDNFDVSYETTDGNPIDEKTFFDDDGHYRYPVGLSINAAISCKNSAKGKFLLKATPWCKLDRENSKKKANKMQCTWKITDVWNNKMVIAQPWSRSSRIKSRMDQAVRTLMRGRKPWTC